MIGRGREVARLRYRESEIGRVRYGEMKRHSEQDRSDRDSEREIRR